MGSKAKITLKGSRAFRGELLPAGTVIATVELHELVSPAKLRLALQVDEASIDLVEPEPEPEAPTTPPPETKGTKTAK